MARAKSKEIKIYLTSWQKRMVADFASKDALGRISRRELSKLLVKWKPGGCLASYKLPPNGIRKDDWVMYLTDEQMKMVHDELGLRAKVSAVNISAEEIAAGNIVFG